MPKPNALINKIPIFESEVAPTMEGAYNAVGGARQIIIPDMDKWTIPKKSTYLLLKKSFNL